MLLTKRKPQRRSYPKPSMGINQNRSLSSVTNRKAIRDTNLNTTGSGLSSHPLREASWVSRLQKDASWTCKFAYQSFTGRDARHDSSRSDAFKDVFGIPCNEVTIINNVPLTILELLAC